MKLILLMPLLVISLSSFGQKEVNNWYFGGNAGITFNTLVPNALTNGQLVTSEGCATISNELGQLLFYTDGLKVWDSSHTVTPNGSGLKGNSSSTQSAVVIPKPGNPGKYYIFTVDQTAGSNGLQYSEFNMALNSGKGDIDTALKNRQLMNYTCEKISAVKHANNIDFWVCTHKFGTDSIFSFLVTSLGINSAPIASATGLVINGGAANTLGYMKVSPDGQKIAYANWTLDTSCIGDFNVGTGRVTNVWSFYINDAYGIEFSATSKFVYFAEMYSPYNIFQFDAKAINKVNFLNSKVSVDQRSSNAIGSLQIGPDKKIYICRSNAQYLDVLHAPDSLGLSTRVQHNAVDLLGRRCSYGLPTFIQSYFKTDFSFNGKCYGDTAWFAIKDSLGIDSVKWNFGDINSGPFNTGFGFRTFHLFSDSGEFQIRSVAFKNGLSDSVNYSIEQLLYLGKLNELGSEVYKCFDDTISISLLKEDRFRYLWNTNSDSFLTRVVDSGFLSVKKYYGAKCFAVDTIKVSFYEKNELPGTVSLGSDVYKCPNDSVWVRFSDATCTNYAWSTGKVNTDYYELKTGILSIKAYYGGSCYRTDTIEIFNHPVDQFTLGPDTFFCPNQSIYLGYWDAGYDKYFWSTGASSPFLVPDTSGTYSLKVKDGNGCYQWDTIKVEALSTPKFVLGKDTFFCDKTSAHILDPSHVSNYSKYKWSTGHSSPTDTVNKTGKYWLTIENTCGKKTDTIQIKYLALPKVDLPADSIYCDSINLKLDAGNVNNDITYLWNTSENEQIISAKDTGLYKVNVSNLCGNYADSIRLTGIMTPQINLGKDTLFCDNFNLPFKIGKTNNDESYVWQELNAQISIGSADTLTWSIAGILHAIVENRCGMANDTILIKQLSIPTLSVDSLFEYCESINLNLIVFKAYNEESYLWSNYATTPFLFISNPGEYWVKAKNGCGVDSTHFKIVLHNYPIFDLGKDSTVCGGLNVLLDATCSDTNAQYLWQTGKKTPIINVTQNGKYKVTVTNFCGAISDSIQFDFYAIPNPNIGPDLVFCDNIPPTFRSVNAANKDDKYLWSNGNTDTITSFSTAGKHWVSITNPCGIFTDSVEFKLSTSPIVDLGKDTVLCGTFSVLLDAKNTGMDYLWSPFGETTAIIYANKQIKYSVLVTNAEGCIGKDEFSIGNNCISSAWFPNSFTPNGDFLNETFKPVLINFEHYEMKIYNRWGELLFETNDLDNSWDGTYKGVACQAGVYFYTCQFISTENNANEYRKGTITLLR